MTCDVMVPMTRKRQNVSMKKLLPVLLLAVFTLVSVQLFATAGLQGVAVFREPMALQVALDLCIATCFAGAWMHRDAHAHGISATPFLILLPLLGSIAALAYLVRRNLAAGPEPVSALLNAQT